MQPSAPASPKLGATRPAPSQWLEDADQPPPKQPNLGLQVKDGQRKLGDRPGRLEGQKMDSFPCTMDDTHSTSCFRSMKGKLWWRCDVCTNVEGKFAGQPTLLGEDKGPDSPLRAPGPTAVGKHTSLADVMIILKKLDEGQEKILKMLYSVRDDTRIQLDDHMEYMKNLSAEIDRVEENLADQLESMEKTIKDLEETVDK